MNGADLSIRGTCLYSDTLYKKDHRLNSYKQITFKISLKKTENKIGFIKAKLAIKREWKLNGMLKRKLDSKHEPTAKRKQTGDTCTDPKPSKREQRETTSHGFISAKELLSKSDNRPETKPTENTKHTKRERELYYISPYYKPHPWECLRKVPNLMLRAHKQARQLRKNEVCLFNYKHTEQSDEDQFLSPISNSSGSFVHINDSDAW